MAEVSRIELVSRADTVVIKVGTNVLAVEVHQVNAGSSDIVFGCALWLEGGDVAAFTPGEANNVRLNLPEFPPVWVSELLARNSTGITDATGEWEPWIELANHGDAPVSLDGWFLSDAASDTGRWPFPAGAVLPPRSYTVLIADGQPGQTTPIEWHTSFRLSPSAGAVLLSRTQPGGVAVVDYLRYSGATLNRSAVPDPNGVAGASQTAAPSPGAEGSPNLKPTLDPVVDRFVMAGEAVRFLLTATDPNLGQSLTFSLVSGPPSLTVNAAGQVDWTPTAAQVGDHEIVVEVVDGAGGRAEQRFIVCVELASTTPGPTNYAPVITTLPGAQAVVGAAFAYLIAAQDADGDVVTFTLDNAPAGAVLTPIAALPNRALLTWTPATAGSASFTILADDGQGGQTSQQFDVNAVATAANHNPVIDSTPRTSIPLGRTWFYFPAASDEDHDLLTFSLDASPTGMTVDPVTGLLTWTPSDDQVGAAPVTLRVADGRGGSVTQSFSIEVTANEANGAPTIVSVPTTAAIVAETEFRYRARATDPDFDPIAWRLVEAPDGASIDAVTGEVRWTPGLNQLGLATIVIEASDTFLAAATQTVSLNVTCVNQPPAILSRPVTTAIADGRYIYGLRAIDPENAPLAFSLTTAPAGMSIDPATGVIRWTPAVGQLGDANVVVRATDPSGASAEQSFTINVSQVVPDLAPIFRTRAAFRATVDELYQYAAQAIDPEGSAVTYALITAPTGMTINANTGLVQWTPAAAQAGSQIVIVAADDAGGHRSQQRYALLARVNQAPEIVSSPTTTLSAGAVFHYDVQVDDPENDPVGFALLDAPAGMTIDELGRITWSTQLADLGPHNVTVQAIDAHGLDDEQTFTLTVVPDTIGPVVSVQLSTPSVAIGNAVVITVQAMDDVGVESLTLTVNGQAVTLTEQGTAIYTPDAPGQLNVVATAADAAGNIGQGSALLRAFDPNDTNGPIVEITSPANGSVVTTLTDIIGTASDPNLEFYRVEYARADLVNVNDPTGADADWNLIVESTTSVVNDTLGAFDPTLLLNDSYVIRVIAQDLSGNVAARVVELSIEGALKFGEVRFDITELQLPTLGVPIEVRRTYDSRAAGESGDFGHGWSLSYGESSIRESVPVSPFESQGLFGNPFHIGARVYLTNPEGERIGFTFDPFAEFSLFGGGYWLPRFRPDPGVMETLEVDETPLQRRADGTFGYHLLGFPYNPSLYQLHTKDGYTFTYDQFQGLQRIVDRRGQGLTFSDSGIAREGVAVVQFVRDSFGRITRIIDPAGKPIDYQYDRNGDLASVTDRLGATTTYEYLDSPAHFFDRSVDPLGNVTRQVQYQGGRAVGVVDAEGNAISYEYEIDASVEHVRDRRGGVTTYEYDDRGNIVRATDPEGNVRSYEFNERGLPVKETDARGNSIDRTYDDRGNEIRAENALGGVTMTTYNELNQPLTLTDELGRVSSFKYDAFGTPTEQIDAAGARYVYTNDEFGRARRIVDPLGRVRTVEYDGANSLPSRVFLDGQLVSVYGFDAYGNRVLIRDASGAATTADYSPSGPVLSSTDAMGATTRSAYDANGNLTAVTDALGNSTTYRYDALGRLLEEQDPLGNSTRYEYDEQGNVVQYTDRVGNVSRFRYDGNNLMIEEAWYEASAPLRVITYEYDAAENLIRVSDPDSVQSFTYDALGRITTATDERPTLPTVTLTYEYDAAGNVTSVSDQDGVAVDSEYSEVDALRRRQWRGIVGAEVGVELAQDLVGRRTLLNRSSDLGGANRVARSTYDYDDLDNLLLLSHKSAADQVLAEFDYDYDIASDLVAASHHGQTTDFDYSANGSLLSAISTALPPEDFDYDALGNRTSSSAHGDDYQVSAGNRLDSDGDYIYEYDANGSLTLKLAIVTGESAAFAYDHRARLVRVELRDAQGDVLSVHEYRYDAFDRRIATIVDGEITNVVYDGATAWADYGATGEVVRRYLAGENIDETLAQTDVVDGLTWFLADRLNTVHDILDASGNLANHIEYAAFGEVLSQSNADVDTRFLFTGRELDPTGMYFYRARYYDPAVGRFISEDPLGFSGGDANLYRYAFNNPMSFVDPSGLVTMGSDARAASAVKTSGARKFMEDFIACDAGVYATQIVLNFGTMIVMSFGGASVEAGLQAYMNLQTATFSQAEQLVAEKVQKNLNCAKKNPKILEEFLKAATKKGPPKFPPYRPPTPPNPSPSQFADRFFPGAQNGRFYQR